MSEVYGAGSGISQGIGDLHNMALTGLQTAEAMKAQEQLRQDQLANQIFANMPKGQPAAAAPAVATPAYGQVSPEAFGPQGVGTAANQAPITQHEAMAAQGMQASQNPNLIMADRLGNFSLALADAGLPQKAMEVAGHSATLRHNAMLAQKDQIETQVKQWEVQQKELETVGSIVGSYLDQYGDNPASFENAKHALVQQFPQLLDHPSFLSEPYKPGVMAQARESAIHGKDQLVEARQKANDKIANDLKEQNKELSRARAELITRRVRLIDTQIENAKKNGGSSGTIEELRAARIAAIKEGYIGKTPATAIVAPNDQDQWKDSHYYISPKTGQVGRWNAKAGHFETVAPGEFKTAPTASDPTDSAATAYDANVEGPESE